SAGELAEAVGRAAERLGWRCDRAPVADGGEGTLDALGGPTRLTRVRGPLGDPVEAEWRIEGDDAVVEMARASGLALAGGPEANDPIHATTYGTGQLIAAAGVGGGGRPGGRPGRARGPPGARLRRGRRRPLAAGADRGRRSRRHRRGASRPALLRGQGGGRSGRAGPPGGGPGPGRGRGRGDRRGAGRRPRRRRAHLAGGALRRRAGPVRRARL